MKVQKVVKDVVQVSEHSRFEAHGSLESRLTAANNLFARLVGELKETETELAKYNSVARVSAQVSIRQKYSKNQKKSFEKWQKKKAEMSKERIAILVQKSVIETQMRELKPELNRLRREDNEQHQSKMVEILDILVEIRDLLKNKLS